MRGGGGGADSGIGLRCASGFSIRHKMHEYVMT